MTHWTECKAQGIKTGVAVIIATVGGAAFELTKHADTPIRMAGETFGPALCLVASAYSVYKAPVVLFCGAKAIKQAFMR